MKDQIRCARFTRANFDVPPSDAIAPTRLECLEGRFFCREARGIMLSGCGAACITVVTLCGSENTIDEPGCPLQHFPNARDFDNVYANGNDHKRNGTRRLLLAPT